MRILAEIYEILVVCSPKGLNCQPSMGHDPLTDTGRPASSSSLDPSMAQVPRPWFRGVCHIPFGLKSRCSIS